jgi:L-lactate dehydrogenase complex protein LldF
VKIDLHEQLYRWRQLVTAAHPDRVKATFAGAAAGVFSRPPLYRWFGRWARTLLRRLPRRALYGRLNVWGRGRELPAAPAHSFREWYRDNRRGG